MINKKRKYTDDEFLDFISSITEDTLIQTGFKKSGNTWFRFIIYHYYLITNEDNQEVLTYDDLNAIQSHVLENETIESFDQNYPALYRTHERYRPIFNDFEISILIIRHPLDALVSLYYYQTNRKNALSNHDEDTREALFDINYFVLYHLGWWIKYHLFTLSEIDVVIKYEDLKKHPKEVLKPLIKRMDVDLDKQRLEKAIELSSFKSIKQMQRKSNQERGMAAENFTGKFARKGQTGEYRNELDEEVINYCQDILEDYGLNYDSIKSRVFDKELIFAQ